jgi:hypothetical protein
MILYPNKPVLTLFIFSHCPRIQAQTNQRIDNRRLRNRAKSPTLLVFKLYEIAVVADDFVALVGGVREEFGEREPLPRHLVAVVGVDELVIVDAVGGVAGDALDGGGAGVEG